MAEKKWGKAVLGWFVVDENAEKEAPASVPSDTDALIAKYSGAGNSATATTAVTTAVPLKGELPTVSGGQLDFAKIFEAAGCNKEEQDRVTKAKELLKSLPVDTPLQVKRQIVEASLKAFGYPIRDLIEAGVEEIQALESYIQTQAQQTQKTLSDATTRIEKLNKEIADLKLVMQQSIDEQATATKLCNDHKLTVQQVLEFFGMDEVAKVVQESPKLVEPK